MRRAFFCFSKKGIQFICAMYLLLNIGCKNTSNFNRGSLIPSPVEPTQIDFETVKKLIIIKAEINGATGRFLFDNGFSLSAVNQDFATKAGITANKSTNATDANNKKTNLKEATVKAVIIGQHQFINTGFYIIDTDRFLPCDSLDGVIGASIINKANWQIDFEDQQMKISSQSFGIPGFILESYLNQNNSSFTYLTIQGEKIKLKFDLGSNMSIKLNQSDFYSLFIDSEAEKRIGVPSFSATGMGNIDTFYKVAQPVELIRKGRALPLPGRIRLSNQMKYPGYIGIDYLNDYLLTINSSEGEYILSENASSSEDKARKSYGVSIYPIDGEWKVIQLNPNQASLSGIRLMDQISIVDSIPVNEFNGYCNYQNYLNLKTDAEEPLVLTTKNGRFEIPYMRQTTEPLK